MSLTFSHFNAVTEIVPPTESAGALPYEQPAA